MKIKPNLVQTFFFWMILLTLPVTGLAQTYTNLYGMWSYGTTNGAITLTGFSSFGSTYTTTNKVITLPGSINGLPVTAIAGAAFEGDYGDFGTVTIPNSITSIGANAFSSCTYLSSVLVGNSVTNVGDYAFAICSYMLKVYFLGNAPAGGTNLFAGDQLPTNYYLPYTTGWTSTFSDAPTAAWNPPLPTLGITAYSNQPVLVFPLPLSFPASVGTNYVVQMTTNLASGNWVTITNAMPIVGLQITNVPSHAFFRLQ